jgi:hypothetical protein
LVKIDHPSFNLDHRKFVLKAPYTINTVGIIEMMVEEIVTRDYVFSDVVTKFAYFSLAGAAFLFVAMLLMTSLHP